MKSTGLHKIHIYANTHTCSHTALSHVVRDCQAQGHWQIIIHCPSQLQPLEHSQCCFHLLPQSLHQPFPTFTTQMLQGFAQWLSQTSFDIRLTSELRPYFRCDKEQLPKALCRRSRCRADALWWIARDEISDGYQEMRSLMDIKRWDLWWISRDEISDGSQEMRSLMDLKRWDLIWELSEISHGWSHGVASTGTCLQAWEFTNHTSANHQKWVQNSKLSHVIRELNDFCDNHLQNPVTNIKAPQQHITETCCVCMLHHPYMHKDAARPPEVRLCNQKALPAWDNDNA